jgi:hypothetical protein
MFKKKRLVHNRFLWFFFFPDEISMHGDYYTDKMSMGMASSKAGQASHPWF